MTTRAGEMLGERITVRGRIELGKRLAPTTRADLDGAQTFRPAGPINVRVPQSRMRRWWPDQRPAGG
jgi:hypothetical protein